MVNAWLEVEEFLLFFRYFIPNRGAGLLGNSKSQGNDREIKVYECARIHSESTLHPSVESTTIALKNSLQVHTSLIQQHH
jgi:hypothetical protein